jgi:hypothetical protein
LVEVSIDHVEHVLMRLDTAAWFTAMPKADATALGLSIGPHDFWIGDTSSGVHVGTRTLVDVEQVGDGPVPGTGAPPGAVLRGTAGNDLWEGYAIGLDLRGGSLWLIPHQGALDARSLPHPDEVDDPIAIPAQLVAGAPPPGRVLYVDGSFDAGGTVGRFRIDTGTSFNLVLGEYWRSIEPASTRSLPLDSADALGSPLLGAFRLGSAFALGGQMLDHTQAAWVVDSFPGFADIDRDFGEHSDGLVSLWALAPYFTVLDFGAAPATAARVFLFPYRPAPKSVLLENFTGFAFEPQADGSVAVVSGSLAAQAGLMNGDHLVGADDGKPIEFLSSGIIAGRAGEVRPFEFMRGGTPLHLMLTAEAVLGP